ncbi:hypothetical protein SEUCBS139899_003033 [Sporothrix eucalyptigena]|uniref:Uncharacterized protein n=1 Tax=Sporothrix eucalyptigena TaxID=1812306 RepID=A0ABP0CUV0_9PEZI
MFSKTASALSLAALLSFAGLANGDATTDISSVLMCTTNIYADGFIYRNTTADGSTSTNFAGFPAKVSFPLYMAVTSHSSGPLYPVQPAHMTSTHEYQSLDENLYINVTTGAFAPVGFAEGSNTTLGEGETTWGFYAAYGFVMWYNLPAESSSSSTSDLLAATPVHAQGFQWVPVDGYTNVTQLYWNQTQYDLAATMGPKANIPAQGASFGLCSGDDEANVLPA